MKRIEDIEKMSLSELTEEASKASVDIPPGLEEGINRRIGHRIWIQRGYRVMAAASLAAVLTVGMTFTSPKAHDNLTALIHNRDTELVDSFEDPALAYAEIERALGKFSQALSSGAEQARTSEQMFNNQKQLVINIVR